ncbi:MAG: hypothetical protein J0H08_09830 [Rhizobiales bacterium]|nr:hypothetical protein [Hyphomicrobiales bacterium]
MSDSAKNDARRETSRFPGRVFGGVLAGVAVATLVADLLIERHGKFGIDGTVGFYAWFGVAGCVAFAAVAVLLGWLLGRPEDYYDR